VVTFSDPMSLWDCKVEGWSIPVEEQVALYTYPDTVRASRGVDVVHLCGQWPALPACYATTVCAVHHGDARACAHLTRSAYVLAEVHKVVAGCALLTVVS
jgi:hypothetical protein